MIALAILAAIVLLSVLAPLIAPQDPADPVGFDPLAANRPPDLSWTYLLGTDGRGRSVLAVLLWGGRTTLVIGVGAALLAALTGLAFGALACWRDGVLDPLVSWLMDVCGAAPALPALLLLSSRLGGVPAGPIAVVLIAPGLRAPPAWAVRASYMRTCCPPPWRRWPRGPRRARPLSSPSRPDSTSLALVCPAGRRVGASR